MNCLNCCQLKEMSITSKRFCFSNIRDWHLKAKKYPGIKHITLMDYEN